MAWLGLWLLAIERTAESPQNIIRNWCVCGAETHSRCVPDTFVDTFSLFAFIYFCYSSALNPYQLFAQKDSAVQ